MERVELHRLLNPYEVLVITAKGTLRTLRCPFRVVCIDGVSDIAYNTPCYVERIEEVLYNMLYYKIGHDFYPQHHFHIYLSF